MPSRSPKPSSAPGCSAAEDAAMDLEIRPATEADVPLILTLINELADYERLSHEVVATEEALRDSLFRQRRDRKSTRLNSSHANISYAVFCLKKKIIIHLS